MPLEVENLYRGSTSSGGRETIQRLLQTDAVRIERIDSHAESSPEGFWYDQSQHEWVILLQGSATLALAEGQRLELKAGDYLLVPPHCKHRVECTSADALWLAVHFR